jgi:phosphoribosylamine--glycine ligase
MKILIVGGGGREHALAWKLAQSPKTEKIYCAPGNAGIEETAECVPIKADDIEGLCSFAEENRIDLTVIGPEVPLSLGLVDALAEKGLKAFGPNRKCARLESSKSFTKAFLERHGIPTAGYREFADIDEIKRSVGLFGYPMVIKGDGLAAGKGVVIAEDEAAALKAMTRSWERRSSARRATRSTVEEYLKGIEASVLCFVDGKTIGLWNRHRIIKDLRRDEGPTRAGWAPTLPAGF